MRVEPQPITSYLQVSVMESTPLVGMVTKKELPLLGSSLYRAMVAFWEEYIVSTPQHHHL